MKFKIKLKKTDLNKKYMYFYKVIIRLRYEVVLFRPNLNFVKYCKVRSKQY